MKRYTLSSLYKSLTHEDDATTQACHANTTIQVMMFHLHALSVADAKYAWNYLMLTVLHVQHFGCRLCDRLGTPTNQGATKLPSTITRTGIAPP